MTARPTTLKLFVQHCPMALDYYEQGFPYDRSVFGVGTAAHDVLHQVALHGMDAVPGVVHALITEGRSGVDAEGPLLPQDAFDGRDLALRWISQRGLVTGGRYELGLAFSSLDGDWTTCGYTDESAVLRTRLDVVAPIADVDEEWESRGLLVADYKSSWAATGDKVLGLDAEGLPCGPVALQQRVQAVTVWRSLDLLKESPEFLRLRISNLRTLRDYDLDLWLDSPDDIATLEGWAEDIVALVKAHEHRPRRANPGPRCIGCPYVLPCGPAAAWWDHPLDGLSAPEDRARIWATTHAASKGLAKLVRADAADGPVRVGDMEVGLFESVGQEPRPDAWEMVCEAWGIDPADSSARGLVKGAKLGMTSLKAIAKALYPERTEARERREWLESVTQPVVRARLDAREVTP